MSCEGVLVSARAGQISTYDVRPLDFLLTGSCDRVCSARPQRCSCARTADSSLHTDGPRVWTRATDASVMSEVCRWREQRARSQRTDRSCHARVPGERTIVPAVSTPGATVSAAWTRRLCHDGCAGTRACVSGRSVQPLRGTVCSPGRPSAKSAPRRASARSERLKR